jgi:hypothetical protein
MAKKQTPNFDSPPIQDSTTFSDDIADMEKPAGPEELVSDMDFTDEVYKPIPLVPNGPYLGNIVEVKYIKAKYAITWDVVLDDNGIVCSDGETPVDGTKHRYNIWLPKPGDEQLYTASGKQTKRQFKINSIMDFAARMGISAPDPKSAIAAIAAGMEDGSWIGTPVQVVISQSEYMGRVRNQTDSMILSE